MLLDIVRNGINSRIDELEWDVVGANRETTLYAWKDAGLAWYRLLYAIFN